VTTAIVLKLEQQRDAADREMRNHRHGTRAMSYWHGVYVGLCDAIATVRMAQP
jgi:hypothetical protein